MVRSDEDVRTTWGQLVREALLLNAHFSAWEPLDGQYVSYMPLEGNS